MKSKIIWGIVIVLGLAVLFFLPSLLMGRFWLGNNLGIMGPGMMGSYGFVRPLGFFGMGLMWLVPLSIVVLVVLGIVALFRSLTNGNRQTVGTNPPGRTCQSCGKPAQVDWSTCPYCSNPL